MSSCSLFVFVSAFSLHSHFVYPCKCEQNVEAKIIGNDVVIHHHSYSLFIMNQMILTIFAIHIACDSFNLTSFSVISDPSGFKTIEWDDEGEYAGGVHWIELW